MPTSVRLGKTLEELKQEHESLDHTLESLRQRGRLTPGEALEVRRIKKLKLQVKDAMVVFLQTST